MNLLIKAPSYFLYSIVVLSSLFYSNRSLANVTLTTAATATGNINRGSSDNLIYAVKIDVTSNLQLLMNIVYTGNWSFIIFLKNTTNFLK